MLKNVRWYSLDDVLLYPDVALHGISTKSKIQAAIPSTTSMDWNTKLSQIKQPTLDAQPYAKAS